MGWSERERGGEAVAAGGAEAVAAAADLLFAVGASLLADLSLFVLRALRPAARAGDAEGERDDDRDERFPATDAAWLLAGFSVGLGLLRWPSASSSSLLEGGGLGLRLRLREDERPRRTAARPSFPLR